MMCPEICPEICGNFCPEIFFWLCSGLSMFTVCDSVCVALQTERCSDTVRAQFSVEDWTVQISLPCRCSCYFEKSKM